MRRLIVLGLGVWLGWWAAREIAAMTSNSHAPGPSPLDSEHPPGWMPAPR